MFPPQQGTSLDLEALSGICGSISIACWVVVFSPQIIENFRRQSADGLSIVFIVVWLAGDVFNVLGALLQGVLPTMLILAVYYTLADVVLMGQVFYYRGFTLSDEIKKPKPDHDHERNGEIRPLLSAFDSNGTTTPTSFHNHPDPRPRSSSSISATLQRHLSHIDGTHLSPATPLLSPPKTTDPPAAANLKPTTTLQAILFNTFAVVLVCAAGFFGWYLGTTRPHSRSSHPPADPSTPPPTSEPLTLDPLGQIFGYLCAVLYLGSRIPQILLNYRRKSTEGVSLLFFLFACIGNVTYDMSIFAYSPICRIPSHCEAGEASSLYGQYILVNASWIIGSLGCLFLDGLIFVQFFLYVKPEGAEHEDAAEGNHHMNGGNHVAITVTDESG